MESNTVQISLDQVHIGMTSAKNIYNRSGLLLVGKDHTITQTHLFRLKLYQIYSLVVYNNSALQVANNTEDKNSSVTLPASKKYEDNQQYLQFKKQYIKTLGDLNILMHSLIQGEQVEDHLYNCCHSLLSIVSNKNDLFEFLYHMDYRTYQEAILVHSLNVAMYCNVFSEWLHYSELEKKELTIAGLLHDIGKFDISDTILNKPGPLSPEEFAVIKQHPSTGFEKITHSNLPYSVKMAVLQHHEKIDGSGYPFGFSSGQIHDFGKIVGIADIYDAMTSERAYHKRVSPFCVMSFLEKDGITVLDHHFLSTFLEQIALMQISKTAILSNGEKGRILFINRLLPSRPLVQVGSKIYNLEFENAITIVDVI